MTMKQKGISFSFSSDDPAVFHTSLAWQYRIALARMGMSREDLFQTILDGVDGAFCSALIKKSLRDKLKAYALAMKLRISDADLSGIEHHASRYTYRRAMTDTFADRVYVSKSQYF